MNHSQTKLLADLRALGIKPGDTIFTHSSMRALGQVEGGCQTVVDAMQAAVGDDGTLLFPAFTFEVCTLPPYFFSHRDSRCCVGALPEYFRGLPDVIRSIHPSHSVCARGRNAQILTSEHILDHTPVGAHSPLALLPKIGGKILMLGCGMSPNTSMHGVEEKVGAPYMLTQEPVEYTLDLGGGDVRRAVHYQHWFHNRWIQRYERLAPLLSESVMTCGKVLDADCFLMDAAGMWETACRVMTGDPYYFVDRFC